ncbi:glutamate synthase large subunit [Pseudenhygromyxa sp. WMMC2535]|uniref:glutamate synthase-related protein n=1 Tax=Pseudenhygromyxa sp. WMMC2535 TaxID=2712867 RepID=UPI00155481D5|nr:glutamate synthase-related protein [Pseudenhygromyxa sp. WMMC2535]NVB37100.1 glutamate synthase large subunit [Pseudenhygromyxa sp. WMMC2535]
MSGAWPPLRDHSACGVGLLAARDGVASHESLERALRALAAVEHRGAVAADGRSSDGAGIMVDIPWAMLGEAPQSVALGCLFVDAEDEGEVLRIFERTFAVFDLDVLRYREVPIRPGVLGPIAAAARPRILHVIIRRPKDCRTEASFEARLYQAKQRARTRLRERLGPRTRERLFFTSLSCRTVVYKALTRADELAAFYPDLVNPRFVTRFALFHRRFSTNTRSTWDKAQPFRLIAHNGEINTIAGNRSWSYSREQALGLAPNELLTHRDVSDSGNLNEQVEALRARSSIPQIEDILAITIPTAGVRNDFYSFWGRAMEPWDGPALIAWSDGRALGARLDRNGFRPARWAMTPDRFVLASEAGIFGLDPAAIEAQGMVGAGSGIKVSLDSGEVHFRDPSVSRENFGARFDARLIDFPISSPKAASAASTPSHEFGPDAGGRGETQDPPRLPAPVRPLIDAATLGDARRFAALFSLSKEEHDKILGPMIADGREPIGSMGDTARPALFSRLPRSFYDYFFQTFAQVTNPPLDYIRERSVTDLSTYLGKRPNIFAAKELLPQAPGLRLDTPVLSLAQLAYVRRMCDSAPKHERPTEPRIRAREIDICVDAEALAADPRTALDAALKSIAQQTLAAAEAGRGIVILSDRAASYERPPLPSLLALRAAVVALNREGLRLESSLVLDTGDVRTTHQLACAVGFGATALCPRLACALARETGESEADADAAEGRLLGALEAGLLKVMSKMGISVVRSYQSAKLFTSLGLSQNLLRRYFPGLHSPVGGLDLSAIGADMLRTLAAARAAEGKLLPSNYLLKEHPRGRAGEAHSMTAARAKLVHEIGTLGARPKDPAASSDPSAEAWRTYVAAGEHEDPVNLRELFELRPLGEALTLDEVEANATILATFGAGAMSFGAISAEAQRDIFLAMRQIGGRSNSGEGGENPWYFVDGTTATTKQVASGRFGVDAEYLACAEEIEIKIAQGAKPGEGGQLMGIKVDAAIAQARHAKAGVDLISPPPLHDIYSIEDLKQLIYELRAVNPRARIAVKLVSGAEIGTIAVGVTKAGADVIQISGGDGGTGAAPISSMKHAGLPWELGLAEVHAALTQNGLRERVRLRVDGGLHRGFDVLVATALGADEFGFGKLLLIAEGCIMARICENNRCPRGIATHDPKFKAKYRGSPAAIVATMVALADEVRELLAGLGLRSLAALRGRSEALQPARRHRELLIERGLDLSRLLAGAEEPNTARLPAPRERPSELDRRLLDELWPKILRREPASLTLPVTTRDRAVLARLSGELALRAHGERMRSLARQPRTLEDPDRACYLPEPGSVELEFEGSAGQGFACFLVRGLEVRLRGEANDSVAKGMSGGSVAIVPAPTARFVAEDNVLIGNCALYGATGGALYLRGRAGDRFAVRNSGAEAVIEGAGMHACEYMTGGRVAILGAVGDNLGAGLTGGVVYLRSSEAEKINAQYLQLDPLDDEAAAELRAMLERHVERTGSATAQAALADWQQTRRSFFRGRPRTKAAAASDDVRSAG